MPRKHGDGGATMRRLSYTDSRVVQERQRASIKFARSQRHTNPQSKDAQHARDEIADYLAREPTRRDY